MSLVEFHVLDSLVTLGCPMLRDPALDVLIYLSSAVLSYRTLWYCAVSLVVSKLWTLALKSNIAFFGIMCRFLLPASLIVINDIMAYFFGIFFGKTPLIKLSPKKTWEGFIGASITTVMSAFMVSFFYTSLRYPTFLSFCEYTMRCFEYRYIYIKYIYMFCIRVLISGYFFITTLSW